MVQRRPASLDQLDERLGDAPPGDVGVHGDALAVL
jgi:hypothetical protein